MNDFPWYAPVGKFMLAFGDIEHTTISLLGCLPNCKIPTTAPMLPLGQRLSILREALPAFPDEDHQEVLRCLGDVVRHSGLRNLVAHNAVWMSVYQEGDRILMTDHLVSARDREKRLTLAQMQRLADDVHDVAGRFSIAAVNVMRQYVDTED